MAIIGNYQVPAEVMVNIFVYLPPEENTQNAKVCRSWRGFAEDVAKKQIIVRTQQEILRKNGKFFTDGGPSSAWRVLSHISKIDRFDS